MRHTAGSWKARAAEKIYDLAALCQHLTPLRKGGATVALLNGSFDLMHAGHLHIIYEASRTADYLVVALNTDSSVQRYKSKQRPIIHLKERMEMVAALESVDFVTWFDQDDPRELLRILRPDVHVNGAEYGKKCIEADVVREIGASLHLVDRIPGLATTDVISAVMRSCSNSQV